MTTINPNNNETNNYQYATNEENNKLTETKTKSQQQGHTSTSPVYYNASSSFISKKPSSSTARSQCLQLFQKQKFLSGYACLNNSTQPLVQLKEMIESLPHQSNAYLAAKRILDYTEALEEGLKESEPLTPSKLLKIACIVEERFARNPDSDQVEYLSQSVSGAPRALVLDHRKQQFLILSKKFSINYVEAAERIFGTALLCGIKEDKVFHTQYAQLVNIESNDVDSMKKQVQLIEDLYQDIFLTVDHTTKSGKKKFFIFEELYEMDLEKALRMAKIPETLVSTIFSQVIPTVIFLHSNGYIHGDIKCANILVKDLNAESVKAKLTDFGMTYNLDELDMPKKVACGYGTTSYSSPESFQASTPLDDPFDQGKADDMFALGCTLYFMLFPENRILPWGPEVDKAIQSPSENANKAAAEKHAKALQLLSEKKTSEADPAREKLIEACFKLLATDPKERLTVEELKDYF